MRSIKREISSARVPAPIETRVPLRLVASGGGLGIELYEPERLGPLEIDELLWSLPGLGFPVDLSGGVRSFRSRRGQLTVLALHCELSSLERWLEIRLRSALGGLREAPALWRTDSGVGVGLNGEQGCLGFELIWAPDEGVGRWVVADARASGLAGPALPHVLSVVQSAFGKSARRVGRIFEVGNVAAFVVRALLPAVGVRAPAVSGTRLSELQFAGECMSLKIADAAPPKATQDAIRATELAQLSATADDALVAGDIDAARASYLAALEKAPRHPELCLMIAAIDADFGERAEAALGLLVESLPATSFGSLGARLLAHVGDHDGARLAISKAAGTERFAPLAASQWVELGSLLPSIADRRDALDHALAASPRCPEARWGRFELRVSAGDVNGAMADAEQLEAAAVGASSRHVVVVRCGEQMQAAGYVSVAGRLFERALRYAPKDAEAALGLALSLLETGAHDRVVTLLRRATQSEEERVRGRALLALGRVLAEKYDDLPQAISKVREVSGRGSHVVEARLAESSWRAALGDLAGANLAFARMRDMIELDEGLEPGLTARALSAAATFCSQQMDDAGAAERHLALALRRSPRSAKLQSAYREAARSALPPQEAARPSLQAAGVQPLEPLDSSSRDPVLVPDLPGTPSAGEANAVPLGASVAPEILELQALEPEDLELQARDLRARFLAFPSDQAVFAQLSFALKSLGQHIELHALLMAAYEDTEGESRLLAKQQLLSTLEDLARDEPDPIQQELFRQQAEILEQEE